MLRRGYLLKPRVAAFRRFRVDLFLLHEMAGVERRRLQHQPHLEQLVAAERRRRDAFAGLEPREPAAQIAFVDPQPIERDEQVAGIQSRALRGAALEDRRELETAVAYAVARAE